MAIFNLHLTNVDHFYSIFIVKGHAPTVFGLFVLLAMKDPVLSMHKSLWPVASWVLGDVMLLYAVM